MTRDYIPALGRFGGTGLYDRALALLTRERSWRGALTRRFDGIGAGVVVDIGCGTGSLAIALKTAHPGARIIALDPDEDALSIARRKATACHADVEWLRTMGDDCVAAVGAGIADIVVSSLVLHQCPLDMKRAILTDARALLRPGGQLLLCDYGVQPTLAMRLGFLLVQLIDGFDVTRPNAAGVLPRLIEEAGFVNVIEDFAVSTVTGRIALYSAVRG